MLDAGKDEDVMFVRLFASFAHLDPRSRRHTVICFTVTIAMEASAFSLFISEMQGDSINELQEGLKGGFTSEAYGEGRD